MSRCIALFASVWSVGCLGEGRDPLAPVPPEARPLVDLPSGEGPVAVLRPTAATLAIEALDLPGANPLMKQVHVALPTPGNVHLECTSPDDALEDFVFASPGFSADRRFDVTGLLPETRYDCFARATDVLGRIATGRVAFETGALPASVPKVTIEEDDGQTQAYFLYNHRSPIGYAILDRDGKTRWYEEPTGAEGDADIGVELAWQPDLQQLLACGGNAVTPQLTTLTGALTWTAPPPDADYLSYHHDCARLADGGLVALESNDVTYQGVGLYGTAIKDFAPDGTLLWQWSTQEGIDEGRLQASSFGPGVEMDPWHANSVAWLDDGQGPAAFLSLYGSAQVLRVDRTTGTISWVLGKGGDFALVGMDGHDAGDDWFDGQHGLDWQVEADGLHALIYDNALATHESRVMELLVDPVALRATEQWVFTEPHWATPIWGDADWLPDGDVLVAKGHCSTCDIVDKDERSEILVLDPVTHAVTWRAKFKSPADALYRAQQIDACDLFANARFCPEISSTLDPAGELHAVAADQR